MNRKGLIGKVSLFSLVFLSLIGILIFILPVFGIPFTSVVVPSGLNASTSNQILNFTVVNINATGNITEVSITLPNGFALISNSNATTASSTFFSNTTTNFSWSNTTEIGFVPNETTRYFTINVSVPSVASASYNFNVSTLDTSGVYNSTIVTVEVNDTKVPTWSANQSSLPTNYSSTTASQFNLTWSDNVDVDAAFITIWNSTGVLVNNASMSNTTFGGGIYNYSIILPAGTFNWTSYTNDTKGNWNATDTWTFTIGQASNPINLYFNNGTEYQNQNIEVTYNTQTNTTGLCSVGTCNLYRNDSAASSENNTLVILAGGVWNYTVNTTGNSNYSSNTTSYYITVNKASNPVFLYFSGIPNANKSYVYPSAVNATGTATAGTVYIYRNGTHLSNGTSPQSNITCLIANNTYPYKVNATGNANYSDNTSGVTFNATVNRGALVMTLEASPSNSVTYPTETTVTGAESNIGDNYTEYELWRDSSFIDNSTYQEIGTLAAGTYVYRFNSSGGENWTANSTGVTLTMTVTGSTFTPGGGGGTIPTPTKITRTKGKAEITIPSVSANKTVNITIQKTEDMAFRKLSINFVNAANKVKITITKLAGMPSTIYQGIEGRVYHYINVGLENITDAGINRTIIRLAVNKSWLTDNSINSSNISLYRWESTRWSELPTSYSFDDAFEYYYEAVSPGFSVFAIGESGGVPEIEETCTESWSCTEWSECVNATQTRTCTDSNACGTAANKPAESQACETIEAEAVVEELPTVTIVAVALLIVIVIVVLIFLRSRGLITVGSSKQDYY